MTPTLIQELDEARPDDVNDMASTLDTHHQDARNVMKQFATLEHDPATGKHLPGAARLALTSAGVPTYGYQFRASAGDALYTFGPEHCAAMAVGTFSYTHSGNRWNRSFWLDISNVRRGLDYAAFSRIQVVWAQFTQTPYGDQVNAQIAYRYGGTSSSLDRVLFTIKALTHDYLAQGTYQGFFLLGAGRLPLTQY